jgi:hypothetical protein
MRAHMHGCEACRRYYERRMLLAKLDPKAVRIEERIARGLGLRLPRKGAPIWSAAFALCAAAAVLLVMPLAGRSSQFISRGVTSASKPELFAYRMHPTAKLAEGGAISPTEDLAFAYTNPSGFERLLVYGVDEHRHVYWYYPAWSNPSDDPDAIALTAGPEVHELPDAIAHDIDGDRLTIVAVFLHEDTSVRRVERLVADSRSAFDPLPMARSYEQRLTLTVGR